MCVPSFWYRQSRASVDVELHANELMPAWLKTITRVNLWHADVLKHNLMAVFSEACYPEHTIYPLFEPLFQPFLFK